MGIISAIIIFSFVIFIHELGHFIVGLKLGANPKEFSIGFGRALIQREIKGVNFKLGGIPFGGYVRFEKDSNHPLPELRISHWRGILIYFAGPFFNILLSYLMLLAVVFSVGMSSPDKEFAGKLLNQIKIQHELSDNVIIDSVNITNILIYKGTTHFIEMFQDGFESKQLIDGTTGPIGITSHINDTYENGTWLHLYFFTMFLSISLGITNLLPLGILDGGRIMSSVLKLIFSERITPLINWYDRFSLAFLLGLAAVVTIKDLFELMVKITN